jgi:hypothetical protein
MTNPTRLQAVQLGAALRWKMCADELAIAKNAEAEARALAVKAIWPKGMKTGTSNHELHDGSTLKGVVRPAVKVDPKTIKAALAKLVALGDAGVLLAERLVKWTPEASIGEIKKLSPRQWKLFSGVITVGQSGPSLELKPAD